LHSNRGVKDAANGRGVRLIRNEGKRNLVQTYSHFPSGYAYKIYRQDTVSQLVMLILLYTVPGRVSYSECPYFCDLSYIVNKDCCSYRGSQRMWNYTELEITYTWEAGINSVRHFSTQLLLNQGIIFNSIWSPSLHFHTHKYASYIMSMSKRGKC
jgi:hypothetical protein